MVMSDSVRKEGRKINVTKVENISPKRTIAPTPRYSSVPAPGKTTNGAIPNTVVVVDIKIGRILDSVAV